MPETTTHPLPELLCPAGDMARLDAALLYGADACYLGGTVLSLRAGSSGFTWDELDTACRKTHAKNAKIYFTLNVLPQQHHLADIRRSLEKLAESKVDGLIVADPGVISMARRIAPNKELHLSTQANTANSEAVGFWHDLGIGRVNVARELGAHAIRQLAKAYPSMELETFVHGAMCLAISGRCMLSSWLNQRPANLGECTHPCRFEYKGQAVEDLTLRVNERMRPDESVWEITEEGEYSRFWAPDDLCLVKYLRWFTHNNIASIKIEGRMKTPSYVAHVVDAYRTALDDIPKKIFRPEAYLNELRNTASRRLCTGFFLPSGSRKTWDIMPQETRRPIVAQLAEQIGEDAWRIAVRSSWRVTADAELMLPGMRRPLLPKGTYSLENQRGEQAETVHPGTEGILRIDFAKLDQRATKELISEMQQGMFLRGLPA